MCFALRAFMLLSWLVLRASSLHKPCHHHLLLRNQTHHPRQKQKKHLASPRNGTYVPTKRLDENTSFRGRYVDQCLHLQETSHTKGLIATSIQNNGFVIYIFVKNEILR